MRRRHGRLAKLLSIPVLAVSGFAVAATLAGVGLATEITSTTTSTSTTTPPPTTIPTTTTTTTTPTTTTTTTTTAPPGGEGCTPGFWKNHPEDWEVYSPDQSVDSVFAGFPESLGELTLLEGLRTGGGGVNALMRHAIAALLAAAHSEVEYPLSTEEIIDMVNDALASGDAGDIEALKDTLDEANNAGAPGFCD